MDRFLAHSLQEIYMCGYHKTSQEFEIFHEKILNLTISCAVVSWELFEVCGLESLVIPVHRPHDTRPWLLKHL